MPKKKQDGAYYADTNGVPMADGRVTHLGLAAGELASRIITVGSLSRAKRRRSLAKTTLLLVAPRLTPSRSGRSRYLRAEPPHTLEPPLRHGACPRRLQPDKHAAAVASSGSMAGCLTSMGAAGWWLM